MISRRLLMGALFGGLSAKATSASEGLRPISADMAQLENEQHIKRSRDRKVEADPPQEPDTKTAAANEDAIPYVANVFLLRSYSGRSNAVCCGGYHLPGDGGGGLFTWKVGDRSPDDGGIVFASDVRGARGRWVRMTNLS